MTDPGAPALDPKRKTEDNPHPPGTRIRLSSGWRYLVVADKLKVCGHHSDEGRVMSSGRACDKPLGHEGRHRYNLHWNIFDDDPRLRSCWYWVAELVGVPEEFRR